MVIHNRQDAVGSSGLHPIACLSRSCAYSKSPQPDELAAKVSDLKIALPRSLMQAAFALEAIKPGILLPHTVQ